MENKARVLPINKSRQVNIDLLECIAILLVLIYHSTLYSSDIVAEPSSIHYVRYFIRTILSPCVPLFFFANGYLLFNREFNLKKHIMKMLRFVVLCFVWGFGKTLILMPIEHEFLSPGEIWKAVWSWKQGWINSLWFIGALICLYIIFPLLKVAYDHNKKIFLYFVVVCAILTFGNVLINEGKTVLSFLAMDAPTVSHGYNFFGIFNPFRGMFGYAFVYFCIGGYFYNIKDKLIRIRPFIRNSITIIVMLISCIGLWGVGVIYSKASGSMWDLVWNGYDTIFTFLNVICIFMLCLNLKKDIKLIRLISCNTLGIYFIHEIFIHLTQNRIMQHPALCNIPFNILYAVIILLICLVIALGMRKVPVLKKLVG